MGRRSRAACGVALAAVGVIVGGCAGSLRPAATKLVSGQASGVEIQQVYDSAGNPSLGANSAHGRPRWSVCGPRGRGCRPINGLEPAQGPTSSILEPGKTAPGRWFLASAVADGTTYDARTATWLGTVRVIRPPRVVGRARVGSPVSARGAIWSGGWSRAIQGYGFPTDRPNLDELSIEACRTRAGTGCVNLTPPNSTGGFSRRPVLVDPAFAGWWLFAFDQRRSAATAFAEPGYPTPASVPPLNPGATVARSGPIGPVTGPPPPHVELLHYAIARDGQVLVARVRCRSLCTVDLFVNDHLAGSAARLHVLGNGLVGVKRRGLRPGTLAVLLWVDAGPVIRGQVSLR